VGHVQTIFAGAVCLIIVQVSIVQKICAMTAIPKSAQNVTGVGVMHVNTRILKFLAKCCSVTIALKDTAWSVLKRKE